MFPTQARKHTARLWNRGQTLEEVRNRGISGPTKRTYFLLLAFPNPLPMVPISSPLLKSWPLPSPGCSPPPRGVLVLVNFDCFVTSRSERFHWNAMRTTNQAHVSWHPPPVSLHSEKWGSVSDENPTGRFSCCFKLSLIVPFCREKFPSRSPWTRIWDSVSVNSTRWTTVGTARRTSSTGTAPPWSTVPHPQWSAWMAGCMTDMSSLRLCSAG